MKTKITCILLVCTVLVSCSKLPYGHGPDGDDDEIVLTENNYVFEGDLYKYALNSDIDSLQQREKDLLNMVGQDPKLQEELKATNALLIETVAIENSILGFSDITDLLGRRIPNPPRPPRPGVLPDEFRYILRYNLQSLSVIGLNQDSKLVLESDEGYLSPVPGTKGRLQIQNVTVFNLESKDIVTLTVKRKNNKGKIAEYKVDAKVQM